MNHDDDDYREESIKDIIKMKGPPKKFALLKRRYFFLKLRIQRNLEINPNFTPVLDALEMHAIFWAFTELSEKYNYEDDEMKLESLDRMDAIKAAKRAKRKRYNANKAAREAGQHTVLEADK